MRSNSKKVANFALLGLAVLGTTFGADEALAAPKKKLTPMEKLDLKVNTNYNENKLANTQQDAALSSIRSQVSDAQNATSRLLSFLGLANIGGSIMGALPQGPKGDTGPKGDIGAQGDVGPQGPIGPQGAQGPQGEKGDKGEQGEVGPAGSNNVLTVSVTPGQCVTVDLTNICDGPAGCRVVSRHSATTGNRTLGYGALFVYSDAHDYISALWASHNGVVEGRIGASTTPVSVYYPYNALSVENYRNTTCPSDYAAPASTGGTYTDGLKLTVRGQAGYNSTVRFIANEN